MDAVLLSIALVFGLMHAWGAWSLRAQLRTLSELMRNAIDERRHTRGVMRVALGSRRARAKSKVPRR